MFGLVFLFAKYVLFSLVSGCMFVLLLYVRGYCVFSVFFVPVSLSGMAEVFSSFYPRGLGTLWYILAVESG